MGIGIARIISGSGGSGGGGSTVLRAENDVACNGGNGQVIPFSSDLPDGDYALNIYDKNGLGIQWVSQNKSGFTINSLGVGVFDYQAIPKT